MWCKFEFPVKVNVYWKDLRREVYFDVGKWDNHTTSHIHLIMIYFLQHNMRCFSAFLKWSFEIDTHAMTYKLTTKTPKSLLFLSHLTSSSSYESNVDDLKYECDA